MYRVYVEKKKDFAHEAKHLYAEITQTLQIKSLSGIRLINRYDAENIEKNIFDKAVREIFSEPQVDDVLFSLPETDGIIFGVEYLAGQYDQRADSAEQCVQFVSQGIKPQISTAKIYILQGKLSKNEIDKIKKYLINPVECKEADLAEKKSLYVNLDAPKDVEILSGFSQFDKSGLENFVKNHGLAMDIDDIFFAQQYFKDEDREPTIAEIKLIDTYWSDHCRHTTFSTVIDKIEFESEEIESAYQQYLEQRKSIGRTKPVTLMDLATTAMRCMHKQGKLPNLDVSDEINACTVKIKITIDGEKQDWLLLFKNETHNHPTEIEPFGGAATCLGGAIRDPLSGRAYVYSAMRLTGAGDPLTKIEDTPIGKLPQRKIVTTAAAGYSSYGNQIGLTTGLVDEIYHSGYVAKRMEIGAVIGATPSKNVVRKTPDSNDVVILLGGKTGRDGIGGATGSSKAHTENSIHACGAEVQKGNAPEERKIQRFFRNEKVTTLIKRCNDFGAGGVAVAVGELADGLDIELDKIPKKYEGLNGTELAISESQERMAVVVNRYDAEKFINYAKEENLSATIIAKVTDEPRLVMRWQNKKIVDISREFLSSNGAEKHINAKILNPEQFDKIIPTTFSKGIVDLVGDLNVCSKRGLVERFDSTVGANTVLMPFGGKNQSTPPQVMAQKIAVEKGDTDDCSIMAWGFNPYISEKSPYHGAYLAVVDSVAKAVAAGADYNQIYLTFQEYFEKLGNSPEKWGKPLAALLGANKAQFDLGIASIGGKDSMSGSFENISVPPTLVSFAVGMGKASKIVSPEFKKAENKVFLLSPEKMPNGLPNAANFKKNIDIVSDLIAKGKILSAYAVSYGGICESVYKMCLGNGFGFEFSKISLEKMFGYNYGSFILEVSDNIDAGEFLGTITKETAISYGKEAVLIDELLEIYDNKLESVYPTKTVSKIKKIEKITYNTANKIKASISIAKPKVLIPVFPGTNCEYETAKAFEKAGAKTEIFVVKNLDAQSITESLNNFANKTKESQIIFIPGGFSGGDEPDGSAKFITSFMRNERVAQAIDELLGNQDGLMCGICNGFQALVKLGLLPFGKIISPNAQNPTLTHNDISRHQSRIVRIRVASNLSPWFNKVKTGEIYNVPISHGEGKFVANEKLLQQLASNGQIATQYIDFDGNPTMDTDFNPNGSVWAIEGITSADGRILGKMGHSERIGKNLYKNVTGEYDMQLFESAVEYFK